MLDERSRGEIAREHVVQCAICDADDRDRFAGSLHAMAALLRERGWGRCSPHGWCCPDCLPRMRDGSLEIAVSDGPLCLATKRADGTIERGPGVQMVAVTRSELDELVRAHPYLMTRVL